MLYRYHAVDAGGKPATGTTEAGSPADARAALREQGITAYELREATPEKAPRAGGRGVSWLNLSGRRLDLLTHSTRHLALLLKAGVPLGQAVGALAGQTEDRRFREALEHVSSRVKEGMEFHQALSMHPAYFPELYRQVARAGVQAGELPKVLVELGAYYSRQKKIRDRVVSAITYPMLMCGVGVLVLVFLLTFVVPKVTAVLLEQERALPWPTLVLLGVSGWFSQYWWIALPVTFAGILAAFRGLSTERGRRLTDWLMLTVPVLGDLFRKQAVARWAGTMSTLLSSGLPVDRSLSVVRGAVGNVLLAEEVGRLEREVMEGARLSDAMRRSTVLPPTVSFIAAIGEESGELHEVLREIADSYNEEVEIAAGRLTDLLNPVLIVVLGVAVGFIVAAILLPITDFSNIH